jgi:hypothetical protein
MGKPSKVMGLAAVRHMDGITSAAIGNGESGFRNIPAPYETGVGSGGRVRLLVLMQAALFRS